jgi:uncharacterized protein YktA (UPF0223 family)
LLLTEDEWEKQIKANIEKSEGKTKYRDIQFAKYRTVRTKMKTPVYSKWVVCIPIIIMAITLCILLFPEIYTLILNVKIYVPPLSDLQYPEKFNIWLTIAITTFTAVGSYSTYMQIVSARERNRIEDARNELEKAYGILFAVLNYRAETEESGHAKILIVHQSDFKTIDEIMATYVWMFPKETNDLWNKTRRPTPIPTGLLGSLQEPIHSVSFEFRDKINREYDLRVKKYYALLGKT